MLAAHERAAGLLDRPSGEVAAEVLTDESRGDSSSAAAGSSSGSRIGPYLVRDEIGRGGMGVVYRAVDPRLHRDVALKLLSPSLMSNEKARQRLLEEARAASALDHPNICTIYDIGKADDDSLYVAMAYYEGQTLAARIEQGALPAEEALPIAAAILRGLENAHANGVIHRDIKPSNVLITKRDEVKILDFGLAKRGVEQRTDPDAQLGTLAYMSPEQVLGQTVDARTDLWSLGVTLHQMLAGKTPFAEPQEAALLYAIAHEAPATLPESVPARARSVGREALGEGPKRALPECIGASRRAGRGDDLGRSPRRSSGRAAVTVAVRRSGGGGNRGPGAGRRRVLPGLIRRQCVARAGRAGALHEPARARGAAGILTRRRARGVLMERPWAGQLRHLRAGGRLLLGPAADRRPCLGVEPGLVARRRLDCVPEGVER